MNAPISLPPEVKLPRSRRGEPVWEIAQLFYPYQGEWTEKEYLRLDANTNKMIELVDGCLEFLPKPMPNHQFIVRFLFKLLDAYVAHHGLGEVLFAPCPVRLGPDHFREPDILFLRQHRLPDLRKQPEGADLVMEVVSPGEDSRKRDLVAKREDYAAAGIQEYWIIDLEQNEVTVLALDGKTYRKHGVFRPGSDATSAMFPDFRVPVRALFAAGQTSA